MSSRRRRHDRLLMLTYFGLAIGILALVVGIVLRSGPVTCGSADMPNSPDVRCETSVTGQSGSGASLSYDDQQTRQEAEAGLLRVFGIGAIGAGAVGAGILWRDRSRRLATAPRPRRSGRPRG